jgi:uncharacterized protein YecE (DUF72 family)
MAHRFYCGTSGWNYRHWSGVLYPAGLPRSRWLSRYSEQFRTVEINNTFYRLPERETFDVWRRATPDGFVFAVKASRFLSHMRKLKDPEEPLQRLLSSVSGLEAKLGPTLYQLPPHWSKDLNRLNAFLQLLPAGLRHVFEFRDASWQSDDTMDLLRRHGAGYCIMSAPDLPLRLERTAGFAYIRMHNGGYETGSNYPDDALEWWAGRCAELLESGDLYVYFNNDARGYAVYNAMKLEELVRLRQPIRDTETQEL